jgi:hypothetical protein
MPTMAIVLIAVMMVLRMDFLLSHQHRPAPSVSVRYCAELGLSPRQSLR